MTPETQEKLIDLARRGAKCEAWAEWCKMALERSATTGGLDVNDRRVKREYRPAWYYIGPLPSCTYTDDQLGEFLECAEIGISVVIPVESIFLGGAKEVFLAVNGKRLSSISGRTPTLLEQLEAAITIVERAHRLGEYAHYTETEAAPYLAAFNRGIGQ